MGARLAGLGLLLAFLLHGPAGAQALDKVKVRLMWTHQAQFAGFYLAQDRGLYQRAGLEVDILPANPHGQGPLEDLGQGECDFAMGWLAEALIKKAHGLPLVHLAQVVQRPASLLVTFQDSGLSDPHSLAGQRVGLWQGHAAAAPRVMFRSLGIGVNEIRQGSSISPFLSRAVDAASAMLYNEIHMLYQAGIDQEELNIFDLEQLGFGFPEDGIYARESTWQKNPGLCRRFVQATLDGWRLAFKQPEAALESTMKRVDESRLASNQAHQRWMLKIMAQIITARVGLEKMGELDPQGLERAGEMLFKNGFLPRATPAGTFCVPAWQAP
jgi:NitT/TauT family transport system substrate-binding protein